MIDHTAIDFAGTSGTPRLLDAEPAMQQADENGLLTWTVTLAVLAESCGRMKYEVVRVTVTCPDKRHGAFPLDTPMTVEGLELGPMPQTTEEFSVS
jgi:hypothetical protein